ncbi:hypothetical protein BC829DRAFT_69371 [Chytridium lagenaria]|nr:hypothetical protein BC829DRAFT_69371 [Chytridium lagenaria]
MLGSRVSVKDEKKAVMVKRKRTDKPVASSLSSVVGAKKLENDSVTPSKPIKRRRTMNSLSSFKKPPLNNLTVSKAVSVSSKTVTRSVPKKRIVKPREASPYMDPARVSTSPTLKANVLGKRVAKSNKWEDPLPPIMNHSTGEMVSVPAKKKTLMEATMMKVDSPIISAAKLKVSPVAPTPNSLQKPSTLRTAKSLNMSVKTGSELSSVKSVPVNGSFGEPLESLVKKVVNATPALITPRVEPPLSEFKDSQFKDAMTPVTGRRSYGNWKNR